MLDKRLFQLVDKKPIMALVLIRLVALGASIALWWLLADNLSTFSTSGTLQSPLTLLGIALGILIIKSLCAFWVEKFTYTASAQLRLDLREKFMAKAFRLGPKNPHQLPPATLAQLTVDGIQQLETYYSRFLPQLFYCLLASLMIFATLRNFAVGPALILLIALPLIPIVIMFVMKIAKKILSSYWGRYTDLGAKFHENLQGLSTLEAYAGGERKQIEMDADAQNFRKITMKLLSMQLNSITIMDIVSYCGAAVGIGFALHAFANGTLNLTGMILFLLLSAEFFIPMRQLGSLFHVAMNGISACQRLFDYLELAEPAFGPKHQLEDGNPLTKIAVRDLTFTYENAATPALKDVNATFQRGTFTAFVGMSGSGKSTFANLLAQPSQTASGEMVWNQQPVQDFSSEFIRQTAFKVDQQAYLYPVSIAENLRYARSNATTAELWAVLEQVSLKDFVQNLPQQLDEILYENGQNLSGGQRQRLILARALLTDSDFYLFDEITSGVDLASEQKILQVIQELAREKIVIFISHRLYTVLDAQQVLVFEDGKITASGTPQELLETSEFFKKFFSEEQAIMAGGARI